jgi:hypothetical protein
LQGIEHHLIGQEMRNNAMQRPGLPASESGLSGLDPFYLAAREALTSGKALGRPVSKQRCGRTKEQLSIIGFGGCHGARKTGHLRGAQVHHLAFSKPSCWRSLLMANRLTMAEIDRILTLHTTEHSNREIADLLGIHREAVGGIPVWDHHASSPVAFDDDDEQSAVGGLGLNQNRLWRASRESHGPQKGFLRHGKAKEWHQDTKEARDGIAPSLRAHSPALARLSLIGLLLSSAQRRFTGQSEA